MLCSRSATLPSHCNESPIPATESTLLLFITHLDQQHILYTTIKVYLAALRSLHITTRHYNSYTQQLTPCLQQVLKGDQMSTCPNHTRLPIIADIMLLLRQVLSQSPTDYNAIMILAACCIAFFVFYSAVSLHCHPYLAMTIINTYHTLILQ